MLVSILGLFHICRGAESRFEYVSIPNLHLDEGERVVGYEIHITSGRIAKLPDIPIGWSLSVDNNASWNSSIKASATVGAAAVSRAFFRDFLVVEKNESLGVSFDLQGEIVVTKDFIREKRIKIDSKDFSTRAVPEH